MRRAISLFAGAGGDTLGMTHAGVNVVAFIEIDEKAIATHKLNFPDCHLIGKDIRKVTETDLDGYVGNIDIVFAGFPCQGFSNAGKKNPNDSRNSLFLEFVRLVNYIKPTVIIGENVPHIETSVINHGGERNAAEAVVSAFEQIGYTMATPSKLMASDYGVPQQRRRCFFVGHRDGTVFDFARIPKNTQGNSLRQIVEKTLMNALPITEETWNKFGITKSVEVSTQEPLTGQAPTNLIKCVGEGKLSYGKRASPTHSEVVDIDKPSKTIICTYARMPRLFVPVCHGTNRYFLRPYTVNELKQIQSFPQDFVLVGSYNAQVQQIGNAVPPKLGEVITREVLKQLF